MRKVLLISPHFPPDSTAGTHRVRLLAPHLARYGWEPTVLTCRTDAYEGQLDPVLASFTPSSLRVERAGAIPPRWTRRIGIGDLGLRSLPGLWRAASRLLRAESYDAIFITIFPAYPALLGPWLVRRFGVPLVLDYQDPWVNAWGTSVGGGRHGRVDFKSRASRWLAERLEPLAVRAASAITAVSSLTFSPILARNPGLHPVTEVIPIGAEPMDFVARHGRPGAELPFDPSDGLVHVCYTGTILPLGGETLRAVLRALRQLQGSRPDLYARLRLHFIGTSNQTVATTELKVLPLAIELGVGSAVREIPTRLPYSTIVQVQQQAGALLAMGSSEAHYTASKIFPLLLSRRPLLAVYHEQSSVTNILPSVGKPPDIQLVTYSDEERAEARTSQICCALARIAERGTTAQTDVDLAALRPYFAENLAGKLASVFDRVAGDRVA